MGGRGFPDSAMVGVTLAGVRVLAQVPEERGSEPTWRVRFACGHEGHILKRALRAAADGSRQASLICSDCRAALPEKNPAAVALGRMGGLKGGAARAASLSSEQRAESARHAAEARWGAKPQSVEPWAERVLGIFGDADRPAQARAMQGILATSPASCVGCHREFSTAARLANHSPTCPGVSVLREQWRARRHRVTRARTISAKRMTKRDLETGRRLYPEEITGRPKSRGECAALCRPCPFVGCKYHLFLDVNPDTGSIKLNFPDLEPEQLAESCALDVAEHGGETLEIVGELVNMTRERIRQLETKTFTRLRVFPIHEFDEEGERRRTVRASGEAEESA